MQVNAAAVLSGPKAKQSYLLPPFLPGFLRSMGYSPHPLPPPLFLLPLLNRVRGRRGKEGPVPSHSYL